MGTGGQRPEQRQYLGNQKAASRTGMRWREGGDNAEGVTQGLKTSSF